MISPILSGLRGAAGIRAEGKQMLLHVKAVHHKGFRSVADGAK